MYQLTSNGLLRNDGAVIPLDPDNRDYADYLKWVATGNTAQPAPPTQAQIEAKLQSVMDTTAQANTFDDLKAAVSYRGDPNPRFAAFGEAFFQWRSAVWTASYAYQDKVKAGTAPWPTIDQAVAMMPAFTPPAGY